MKAVNSAQMRILDEQAMALGITGLQLMENAASAVLAELPTNDAKFLVLCGGGNNGGDGYAIARRLSVMGRNVVVARVSTPSSPDCKHNHDALARLGVPISAKFTLEMAKNCDVIIDAMVGTGLTSELRGEVREAVEIVNKSGKIVYAVDVPSGLNADTGAVCGAAVQADVTVTFALPKIGLLTHDGPDYAGRVAVRDISLPLNDADFPVEVASNEYVARLLQPRMKNSHKAQYGRVLAICGAEGYTGAAYLAGEGALRAGSGLVTVAAPEAACSVLARKFAGVMTLGLKPDLTDAVEALLPLIERADAILFGCGTTTKPEITPILRAVLENSAAPVVLDADGINILAENSDLLDLRRGELILTPHPLEFARLCKCTVAEVEADRVENACRHAAENGTITLFKGCGTIVAEPGGRCVINTSGNPGMATAGSGDLLAGIIASFVGQGMAPFEAAAAGAYVHGLCGDLAAKRLGGRSTTALAMLEMLPDAITSVLGD